jgi:hypothetical protein
MMLAAGWDSFLFGDFFDGFVHAHTDCVGRSKSRRALF